VVHFKRGVYARALRELAPALKKGAPGERSNPSTSGDTSDA